ncbi:MAG: hypothetical protein M1818_005260 [Claussenomyces sp. TS43310]|nr:MAG: hypothetical protein M1818_005260 [Claussenomyces sp. TS43310]
MSSSSNTAEAIEKVDELQDDVATPVIAERSSEGADHAPDNSHVWSSTPIEASEDLELTPPNDKQRDVQQVEAGTSIMPEQTSTNMPSTEGPSKNETAGAQHERPSATTEESSEASNEVMESSTATLKPEQASIASSALQTTYLDPTPPTPMPSKAVSRSLSDTPAITNDGHNIHSAERSPTPSDAGFDERHSTSEDEREKDSRSEIQSIMDQFSEEGGGPGEEEVMSPRLEFASPLLGNNIQYPPRKSSLEPLNVSTSGGLESIEDLRISSNSPSSFRSRSISEKAPAVPPKPGSIHTFSPARGSNERFQNTDTPISSTGGTSLHRPPPPEPEPEPDLPFDFHRFLEQLRHKTADPVAKFLRSFLTEFGKKPWMVHEQVKIIGDFLAFITNKMAQCDVWREVSDAEFDNAREGMEKLVMNRLYTQTFSPAIPPPQPLPGPRSRRKNAERPLGPGRRGQHQEDVERDDVLAQKVSIYGWVKEEHLDIAPVGDSGKRFLILAQQGLLKHSKSDSSADSFMPLLIYVVLQSNPDHLVSNVQYILRFRNQEKLGGEAGYYLSSLMGAVQFIENLDRTSLTISDEDFEKNVEAAVLAIAEKHPPEEAGFHSSHFNEKSQLNRPEETLKYQGEAESSAPRISSSSYSTDNSDATDELPAVSGLLRTIQNPLSTIGRIFNDEGTPSQPARTPLAGSTPRLSPALRSSSDRSKSPQHPERSRGLHLTQEAAARQASAEAAEAQRVQRAEHANVVETLAGMFPDLDKDVISDVVTQKEGRVALAVDACLALSS